MYLNKGNQKYGEDNNISNYGFPPATNFGLNFATMGLWGVVTNYGEGVATKWKRRGRVKFYPYKKGGGGRTSFEVVLTRELEVL